jgi:peptidoglycan hydrolase-like protein with peptidoglycan-binding domain
MQEATARRLRTDEEPEPSRQRPMTRPALRAVPPPAERRTVRISGQVQPARRSRVEAHARSRPDRIALWAVVLGLFLAVVAAATADARYAYETLGNRVLSRGDAGSDVKTLQALLRRRGYALPAVSGTFGPRTARAVRRLQRASGLAVDGRVGPMTTRALAAGWRRRMASYFGPGLYGNRTACGRRLRPRTRGVAHRRLPCGTRIPFYYAGRIVIVPVIDRGPFTRGLTFDLTAGTARALGMGATVRVRAGY